MKLNDRIIKLTIWKSTKESRNKCESDWNIQEGLTADTASSSLLRVGRADHSCVATTCCIKWWTGPK